MGILVGKHTRLIVQGITGREGAFHAQQMKSHGTNVVAGTSPGKVGANLDGIPVFDDVATAVRETNANTSIIFVPAPFAADAIMESSASGLELVVAITEGIPVMDAIKALRFASERGVRVIGPNCPGLMTPGEAKVGIMPADVFREGNIGVVSRSGTLTYEVVNLISREGLGVSTCVGIGGDPVIGTTFVDVLKGFQSDPQTKAVLLIGEIGGTDEEAAASFIEAKVTKPVFAFISGRSAPPGKRMGHAGAIISGTMGTPRAKVAAFQAAGVPVADTLEELVRMAKDRPGAGK